MASPGYGMTHLSDDKSYVEYLGHPASALGMGCKNLLEATKERKYVQPVKQSIIIKNIIYHSIIVLGSNSLLCYLQASLGVWCVSGLCTFFYGLIAWRVVLHCQAQAQLKVNAKLAL